MPEEISTLQAIILEKCPRCRQGALFLTPRYKLNGFYKMHKTCLFCQQTFEPEPGFYFGAMFVSYAMTVAMAITICLILFFLVNPEIEVYITVILIVNVLLLPFIFRYSRTLFLFGFGGIRFDKQYREEK